MTLRPLHDRIIVECREPSEQHIGGIIVPDSAREKPRQGTVPAVGLGRRNDTGARVPVPYSIMKEDDVLAISDRAPEGGR